MTSLDPRHCWVTGMPGQPDGAYPAVLLGWQQDNDGQWWGQVAYAVTSHQGATVVNTWVEGRYLRRADPAPAPVAAAGGRDASR